MTVQERRALLDYEDPLFKLWRHCTPCGNWLKSTAALQRHANLKHDGAKLDQLCVRAKFCRAKLARPIGSLGIEEGPILHCEECFETDEELEAHQLAFHPKADAPVVVQAAPVVLQAAQDEVADQLFPPAVIPPALDIVQPAVPLAPLDIVPRPPHQLGREDSDEYEQASDDEDEERHIPTRPQVLVPRTLKDTFIMHLDLTRAGLEAGALGVKSVFKDLKGRITEQRAHWQPQPDDLQYMRTLLHDLGGSPDLEDVLSLVAVMMDAADRATWK